MGHLAAFLASTILAFAVSGLLLLVGWRFDTLDLFTGAALGLVLGFIGATLFLRPTQRVHLAPSPARYALAGGVMGLVNFVAASAAVLLQSWLQPDQAESPWMKAVLAVSGGWAVARAVAEPEKLLIIATASVISGLVAGYTYGAMLKRPRRIKASRPKAPRPAASRLTPARP